MFLYAGFSVFQEMVEVTAKLTKSHQNILP